MSNDERQGCTGVGRTGWHIDGSFQECPYSHSLYHIVSVPSRGDTGTQSGMGVICDQLFTFFSPFFHSI